PGLHERRMEAGEPDFTLYLNCYFKSVWATLLSCASRRIALDWGRSQDGSWFAATEDSHPRPRAYKADMFREFLEYLELADAPSEWRLELTEEERREQSAFFQPLDDRPVAAVVPASANARKDWIPERFATVVDHLAEDFGYRV